MSIKCAFARSVNTIAVQVAKKLVFIEVARTARLMGIKTPLEETPALSLGPLTYHCPGG